MASIIARRLFLGMLIPELLATGMIAAAQPLGPGPGMMGRGGPGMMGGYWNTGTYLDALKSQLGITADQEPAWKQYTDVVSGAGNQMQGFHQTMFESMGTASWQERRNLMNQMFQARQQAYEAIHAAATKLLLIMDPAQKSKAQSILPGLAYNPGMMGRD